MKKKILITGHYGLLGSRFAKYIINRDYDIVGIDNLSGGLIENKTEGVKDYFIDLVDQKLVDEIFSIEKPDFVFHMSAYAAEGLSPFIRNFNYTNNIIASVNVINACINYNVSKLVFTSSMAVMGHGNPPFKETDVVCPCDPYGNAKAAIEIDLKLAKEQFGLDYTIIRPHNLVGISQNIFDKFRNVVGIFIRQTLNNQDLTIYGDGAQIRAFSDVKFILPCFEKLLETGSGEIFNVGADKPNTILELAQLIQKVAKKFGYNPSIIHLEPRNEVKYAYCDHTKAKALLDFKDETDLEKTITEMFEWAQTLASRELKKMPYEVTKSLYSFWK